MNGPTAEAWRFPSPYGTRSVLAVMVLFAVIVATADRVEMPKMLRMSGEGLAAAAGAPVTSQVADGLASVGRQLFPLVIAERTETSRIADFDPNRLPPFTRLEVVETRTERLDPETLQTEPVIERTQVLVAPFGYLQHVALKMVETLEIAFWGTLLAVLAAVPLAILSASNLTPHPLVRFASRGVVSFCRAIPELISALFLVLAYGFGPAAGVLALAIHSAGFLGKFYAEDIENADRRPQEALRAIGANRLKMLRFAILPQVAPQYVAYTLYVLDRNVRMATVIGLVGGGGIGQELKGRYDMFNYGHVGTILVAIFLLVLALDQVSSRVRRSIL